MIREELRRADPELAKAFAEAENQVKAEDADLHVIEEEKESETSFDDKPVETVIEGRPFLLRKQGHR